MFLLKLGLRKQSNVLADLCLWPMVENLRSLIFIDQSDSKLAKKAKEAHEDFAEYYFSSQNALGTEDWLKFPGSFMKRSSLKIL